MKPINVAVVGLGRAGWQIHVAALKDDPRYRIIGVVDPDGSRRIEAKSQLGTDAYRTIEDLLRAREMELAVIATPSRCHFHDAQAILSAGIHCVLEKPMAANLPEAQSLARLAQQKNRHLFVHHQHAFMPMLHHLQKVIRQGILGPVFNLRICWGGYARRWDWQALKRNGGGQLANTCPHALTVALSLLDGPVVEVTADLRNVKDVGDAEDHVELFLRTESGMTANVIVSSAMALCGPPWMLLGKYGTLTSDGATSELKYCDPEALPSLEVVDAAAPDRAYGRETIPWKSESIQCLPQVPLESFYDNVFEVMRNDAPYRVPVSAALEVMKVIELARQNCPSFAFKAVSERTEDQLLAAGV